MGDVRMTYLISVEVLPEEVVPHPADIHGSTPHVHAEQEEVAMVPVTNTVV